MEYRKNMKFKLNQIEGNAIEKRELQNLIRDTENKTRTLYEESERIRAELATVRMLITASINSVDAIHQAGTEKAALISKLRTIGILNDYFGKQLKSNSVKVNDAKLNGLNLKVDEYIELMNGKYLSKIKFLENNLSHIRTSSSRDAESISLEKVEQSFLSKWDYVNKKIVITFDYAKCSEISIVSADLWTILDNTLTNAIKYGSSGQTITYKFLKNKIIIQNSGSVYDDSSMENIFDLGPIHKNGLGVGLWLIQNLVEDYNGKVYVDRTEKFFTLVIEGEFYE